MITPEQMRELFDTVVAQRDEAVAQSEELLKLAKTLRENFKRLEVVAKRQQKQLEELNQYRHFVGYRN